MGMLKRYLEDLSVEMGYDGEITDEVLTEGERRMSAAPQAAGDDKNNKRPITGGDKASKRGRLQPSPLLKRKKLSGSGN